MPLLLAAFRVIIVLYIEWILLKIMFNKCQLLITFLFTLIAHAAYFSIFEGMKSALDVDAPGNK